MERYEVEYYKMTGTRSNFPSYIYVEAESLDEAKTTAKNMISGANPILQKIRKVPDGEWHSLEERI